ncbi:hypothetical protein [Granulicoccus sp. GXG6511]|uniref:hypothetical protein n=1 Tax=Granulicoccus sp. GXG6511 TaxID=3381351 RepID=UPI003D7D6C1C
MKEAAPAEEPVPSVDWHAVLAFALTGEWLRLPSDDGGGPAPDPDRLLADLAAVGWSGPRLAAAATARRTVPVEQVRALGAARFAAVVADLRARVLAGSAEVRSVSGRSLNIDERRLVAERPPHWG